MSARRLAGVALVCAALAGAGIAARAAAPRPGAGGAVATTTGGASSGHPSSLAGAEPALAAVQQAAEPQTAGAEAAATVPTKLAYKKTLPDSAGRGIAERWCLLCHSTMLITQQAKDSTAWEKTLTQMEKWGVTVTPEERDSLRLYLVQNFGPRPAPPAPAARDSARAPAPPR